MSIKSKNDIAWETLFQSHNILAEINSSGVYEISAEEINKVREARLATKFDHRHQLPAIFRQNQLTIQPNTRGTYLIGRFESYQRLRERSILPIEGFSAATHIETISPENLYSESSVILCAYYTGIITHLLGQDVLLTVFGRMSAGHFSYFIKNQKTGGLHEIKVDGAQLEIDAGFEGESIFSILEAKNQTVNDFLIRQLYYPYRLWITKTRKQVVPVFMSYSNSSSVFSFHVFRFSEENHYNSIELVTHRKYQIVPSDIEVAGIRAALKRVKITPEPEDVPFPQADNFARIIDLLTQLYDANGPLSQDYITSNYAFNLRQTQYYTQAANYLGLLEKSQREEQGIAYSLTKRGERIMEMHPRLRNLALVECIIEHEIFNQALRLYLDEASKPSTARVAEIIKDAGLGLTGTTPERRAQTVVAWIGWIVKLTSE